LEQAGLYGATRSGPAYLAAAYFPVPEPPTRATSTVAPGKLLMPLVRETLAPPIALDDGRLERLLAQLRYPQPYLASFGLQAALVVAGRYGPSTSVVQKMRPISCGTVVAAGGSFRG
jgi:hypothetical protein